MTDAPAQRDRSEREGDEILRRSDRGMIIYVLREGDNPTIDRVDFEVVSSDEVRQQSVVQVTETSLYTKGVPTANGARRHTRLPPPASSNLSLV